jgi:hypothetical protein
MQKMARAQFLLGTAQMPGANPPAILKRVYEAVDAENPEELVVQQPGPPPEVVAQAKGELAKLEAQIADIQAAAELKEAQAKQIGGQPALDAAKVHLDAVKTGLSAAA